MASKPTSTLLFLKVSNTMAPIILKTPQYTLQERIFMVEQKMRNNPHKVLKFKYKKAFPFSGRSPSKMAVWKQTKKFKSSGTLHNLNKGRSGRPKTVLTDDRLGVMRELFEDEKNLPARQSRSSCRRHNLPINMSKSSFNRGVKLLGYHPYKLHHRHAHKPGDKVRRVAMTQH